MADKNKKPKHTSPNDVKRFANGSFTTEKNKRLRAEKHKRMLARHALKNPHRGANRAQRRIPKQKAWAEKHANAQPA